MLPEQRSHWELMLEMTTATAGETVGKAATAS
jgi:hypothetical protein